MGTFPKILLTLTGLAWPGGAAVLWALAVREVARSTGQDHISVIMQSPWRAKGSDRITRYKKLAYLWLGLGPIVIVLESIVIAMTS